VTIYLIVSNWLTIGLPPPVSYLFLSDFDNRKFVAKIMKILVARVMRSMVFLMWVRQWDWQVGARTKRDADGFDRPDILHEALIRHAHQ